MDNPLKFSGKNWNRKDSKTRGLLRDTIRDAKRESRARKEQELCILNTMKTFTDGRWQMRHC